MFVLMRVADAVDNGVIFLFSTSLHYHYIVVAAAAVAADPASS